MQHLRSEISEFGRFFEADRLHSECIRTDSRIGGHDSVYIRPYLDRAGMHCATYQSGGVVASAAAQRCCDALSGRAYKTSDYRRLASLNERQDDFREPGFNRCFLRHCLAVTRVSHDAAPRIDMSALQSLLLERVGNDPAGKSLAEA